MTTTFVDAVAVVPGSPRERDGYGHLAAAVTYERIAGAIAAVTVRGAQVRVHWKDPLTGTPMGESTASMASDPSLGARLRAQARRSVVQEIVGALLRAVLAVVGSALGGAVGGGAGRVVRDVAHTAAHDVQARALAGVTYTDASRRDAVVRAFAEVREGFTWEERAGRFVAR